MGYKIIDKHITFTNENYNGMYKEFGCDNRLTRFKYKEEVINYMKYEI